MSVMNPIFLSASVPTVGRMGYETADPFMIREAVSALVEVVLGRALCVWGGQPAITPMIWEAAKQYGVSYQNTVTLYQSKFFQGSYPKENTRFSNLVEVDSVNNDREASLLLMRKKMFENYNYSAAVFIGGMEGVLEEFELFQSLNPQAKIISIPSPGGVSRELYSRLPSLPSELENAIDFTFWLYKLLDVDMLEPRANTLT